MVPLASDNVDADARAVINEISAAMSPEILRELNDRSITDQAPAETIARDWLTQTGLLAE